MSRASRKSELSPSLTKRPSIDLGKNSSVDMGSKPSPTPSVTSGGIGVSTEITNIGGLSVTGGVSVDISPIDLGINYNAAENSLGIAGGAEIPGGFLGASGGVTIDLDTGQITGGSVGVEGLGLGVNISASKEGGVGVEFTVQIPGTPIELSLGFGFPPKAPTTPTTPTTPTPKTNNLPPPQPDVKWLPPTVNIDAVKGCTLAIKYTISFTRVDPYAGLCESFYRGFNLNDIGKPLPYSGTYFNGQQTLDEVECKAEEWSNPGLWAMQSLRQSFKYTSEIYWEMPASSNQKYLNDVLSFAYFYQIPSSYTYWETSGQLIEIGGGHPIVEWRKVSEPSISVVNCKSPKNPIVYTPSTPPNENPPPLPPFPNPPPTRRNMDECCRDSVKLLRELREYQREQLRLMGRPLTPKGLAPLTPGTKGFLGEKIERVETPLNPQNPNKKIKITFDNYYQMAMYFLEQLVCEDVANDPRSFKRPKGAIQNPEYNRDSEHSLKENFQPDRDKNGNLRELKINAEDGIYVLSAAQKQQYIFEALRRLEYLFPAGEFNDFNIEKSLIAPGKSGVMKVHNHFQTLEVLFQYLNSSLGDPREPIHVADTNPGKKGSQPITVTPFSLSHLMREIFKYLVDMEGDQNSQLNLALRDFRTNLANRVQIVQIAEMVKALFEDSGMVEKQRFIKVKLEGDPYAGCYTEGKGFEPRQELDENTEEASEKLLEATLKNFEMKVKVFQRDNKKDPNDLRDVIIELYNKLTEQQGGRAVDANLVEQELQKAEFNVSLDSALARANTKKAQTASRYRTRKKKR